LPWDFLFWPFARRPRWLAQCIITTITTGTIITTIEPALHARSVLRQG
jgi:hypothetical protein